MSIYVIAIILISQITIYDFLQNIKSKYLKKNKIKTNYKDLEENNISVNTCEDVDDNDQVNEKKKSFIQAVLINGKIY